MDNPPPPAPNQPNHVPKWVLILGVVFVLIAVIFFIVLVVASLFGHIVPNDARFLVCVVLALCVSAGGAFLGGAATAAGKIPLLNDGIKFGVVGGIATFVIVLGLCHVFFHTSSPNIQAPAIIDVNVGEGVSGRKNLSIRYRPEPLPAQHKLLVEVATDSEFKQLVREAFAVDDPNDGDILLSLPKPEPGKTKYWVRLIVRGPDGQIVAKGAAMPFDVSSGGG
jgi:hypothetical protein